MLTVSYHYTSGLLLTVFGFLISYYFYQHGRGILPAKVSWLPSIVQIGDCRCEEIMNTRFGQTFGRSNAYWALYYFSILFILILTQWVWDRPGNVFIFIITLLAFARSIYLAWALYILKVLCRPCITAHTINLGLILLFGHLIWNQIFI